MARRMMRVIYLSRGRRLLIALLQRTTAREVAARCRVYPQRIADWLSGYRVPNERAKQALDTNFGIPTDAWATEWREPRRPSPGSSQLHFRMSRR